MIDIKLQPDEILVLRSVRADMTSYKGFVWPDSGPVEAPDWVADNKCGHGLHGLPWGVGGDYQIGGSDAKYLLVKVRTTPDNYRHGSGEMHDKCKFRRGEVFFCGGLYEATDILQKLAPSGSHINWAHQEAGNEARQKAGHGARQEAGNEAHQEAGINSVQIIRYWADDKFVVKTRIVTEKEAGKPYKFYDGDWHEVEEEQL